MKRRVLIVCTGNSCRSQMAEGLVNAFWGGDWEAYSAGTKPSSLNRRAVEVMAEIGVDIGNQRSKSVDEFVGQAFDLVVTVCDDAAENCPFIPGAVRTIHLPIPDPAEYSDLPDDEALPHFRKTRDLLREKLPGTF